MRFSEYESAETALAVAGLIDWVWVDLFTPRPPDAAALARLKAAGLRLCLVSPELQGRADPAETAALRAHLTAHAIALDAVCTKDASAWR
ncbi:MAG: hypothetical protein WDN24_13075 [Sphingomonas sp.]